MYTFKGNTEKRGRELVATPLLTFQLFIYESLASKRNAALLLVDYVKLDGDKYVLDISEDEASELGVSPENYRYQLGEINKTNELIAQMKANGDSIELPDIQTLMRGAK